jgi:phage terminase Nu1 subunit (DNA packaging protein)
MPRKRGGFDLSAIAQWRDRTRSNAGGSSEELKQSTIRLNTVNAQQKELEYQKSLGQLVEIAAVELWASVALIEAREMILTIPERLATSCPPELRDFVRDESDRICRDVLTMLRRKLETEEIDIGEEVVQ